MCRMNNKINIKVKTNTDLGFGSFKEEYLLSQTGVKASVQPKQLIDIFRAGRKINSQSYNCYLPSNISVSGDDIIVYEGVDYSIVARSEWQGKYIKLYIEEIING